MYRRLKNIRCQGPHDWGHCHRDQVYQAWPTTGLLAAHLPTAQYRLVMESQIRNNQNISTLLRNNTSLLFHFLLILKAQEPLGKLLSGLLSNLRKFKRPNLNLVKKCASCLIKRGLIPTELLKNQPMTTHTPTLLAMDTYKPPAEVYDPTALYAVAAPDFLLMIKMIVLSLLLMASLRNY